MSTDAPLAPLTLPDDDSAEEWLRHRTESSLAEARSLVDRLRSTPPADALAALERWDEVTRLMSNVAACGSLLGNVHPRETVRDLGDRAEQEVDKLATELRQDRALFEVFEGLDDSSLDELAARLLVKTLEDFRRAGVDRDDATRARIAELNDRITELDQLFSRNIREDVRSIRVAPDRLAGMPGDWLDAHPPGEDGVVTVTTDYPDVVPVRTFCRDAEVRHDLVVQFLDRGWPQNDEVLRELFTLRHERATLVGYDSWPAYDAAVKMIGSGPAIPAFIDRIAEAAREPGERDLATVLARLRQDRPDAADAGAVSLTSADSAYYEELVRKEQLDVDAQLVRTYFAFPKVRQGLLEVTGRLFGLRYDPVPDAVVWAPDVTAYDVVRTADGQHLGRIYLDLHPREGKYGHAAQFTLVDGVAGKQLPEGVLVCNFSRGLMEHDQVVTLFHEFGHLLHHVLGGHGRWTRFAGVATEWDFVEAPSQMLEEWAWDADVLRSFATDDAGSPIPAALVERMRRADDFGKGTYARVQMFYAAMSYWFHADRPDDLTARMVELQERYSPLAWIEGTHMFASFGHLGGYSSGYYTYMWSLVIAKDLFSAFDPEDLFDAEVAGRYRDRVLAPGGTKDAADLVADFLGRPYTFDAYAAWLAR
ncbi:M3 family metallopeptidase [Nocardioides sp. SYSU DS0663]|uniref:M3 family metallopeptidase n=1 Tax=Nocardioides sp. SYSU DS0663 TaxID=3416445 RepID=UPI003F4C1ACD